MNKICYFCKNYGFEETRKYEYCKAADSMITDREYNIETYIPSCIYDDDLKNKFNPIDSIKENLQKMQEKYDKLDMQNMKLYDTIAELKERLTKIGE